MTTELVDSPLEVRKRWIESYQFQTRVNERGRVVSVGDGICWIQGLPTVAIDEILIFSDGSRGMVFYLTQDLVGTILIEQTEKLASGLEALRLKQNLRIPVGDALQGRVINPLCIPLDGIAPPSLFEEAELDPPSPSIISRDFVHRPLQTGNKISDTLIPIGKGQRQLLIGDNGLGKSSFALDVVVNQKDKSVLCIYVLIGQKRSSVLTKIDVLKQTGAMAHCVVVVAEANTLPGLQYLAPFAGCSIAEYWMKKGKDTLIVYDDLTAHAKTYRELSLLLRRPPGREAYPADIFFLHSRLLERTTTLNAESGGGSMTALPIIETREGEIASYIPTNLISITDGQILFDGTLFSSGVLPAIDITRSVSRVGGKAQPEEIKQEAGRMKLDYLQFLELEVFTRFGAKLENKMQKRIERGRVLRELLKQNRLSPLSSLEQLAWLIAYNEGFFDKVDPLKVAHQLQCLFLWLKDSQLELSTPLKEWHQQLQQWQKKEEIT